MDAEPYGEKRPKRRRIMDSEPRRIGHRESYRPGPTSHEEIYRLGRGESFRPSSHHRHNRGMYRSHTLYLSLRLHLTKNKAIKDSEMEHLNTIARTTTITNHPFHLPTVKAPPANDQLPTLPLPLLHQNTPTQVSAPASAPSKNSSPTPTLTPAPTPPSPATSLSKKSANSKPFGSIYAPKTLKGTART